MENEKNDIFSLKIFFSPRTFSEFLEFKITEIYLGGIGGLTLILYFSNPKVSSLELKHNNCDKRVTHHLPPWNKNCKKFFNWKWKMLGRKKGYIQNSKKSIIRKIDVQRGRCKLGTPMQKKLKNPNLIIQAWNETREFLNSSFNARRSAHMQLIRDRELEG